MTLAERPYPFPSRTRKSSSPAPKILRGQPFGRIGRRQDFCVSRRHHRSAQAETAHACFGAPWAILLIMTAPVSEPSEATPAPETGDPTSQPSPLLRRATELTTPDVHEICPYLAAAGGAWRSAAPHREHRCRAVDPPAPLSPDKQRRLCLTADHASCQTFRAARASRAAMLAPGVDPAAVAAADAARRPVARSSALILEHPRLSAPKARWPVDRAMSQVALVGLMVVAIVAVAIARLAGRRQRRSSRHPRRRRPSRRSPLGRLLDLPRPRHRPHRSPRRPASRPRRPAS